MSEETLSREATSSIELQRAKDGTYYWTIKRYFVGGVPVECSAAMADVRGIDNYLREAYLGGNAGKNNDHD